MNKLNNLLKRLVMESDIYRPNYKEAETSHFKNGVIVGFKEAFKVINQAAEEEIKKLEEYPVMNERRIAIKKYQDKMNQLLADMEVEYE